MSMIATYLQVDNALGLHLRYSDILYNWLVFPSMRDKS